MSPKPQTSQLGKSRDLAEAIGIYNENFGSDANPYEPKIKVEQISKLGHDVFVSLTRMGGFEDQDIKFIMEIADSLSGTTIFQQTGEIVVNF